MSLPLVAVVGDDTRVSNETLGALRSGWRFTRANDPQELRGWKEPPVVVFLASRADRNTSVVTMLRQDVRPQALLLGLGDESGEIGLALHEVDGWVRVPATAAGLGARLEQLGLSQGPSPDVVLPNSPPRRLGPYHLGKRLGAGSFGAVYEAEDRRDRSRCAIKVAYPGIRIDPESRGRWSREANLLRSVRIPGVVGVRGSGEISGYLCLVMDLLEGRALHELVDANRPLTVDVAIRMGERLGRALGALHALGVVHRDVKPANVVLDPATGVANLTDLGMVVHLRSQELTASDVLLGTAGYLSPERIQGEKASPASDAYALGATLYYALCGAPPYRDKSPIELIRRVSSGERARGLHSLRPDLPQELAARIDSMIAPAAADRCSLADLVDWCFKATS